jgi:hypothetical protein
MVGAVAQLLVEAGCRFAGGVRVVAFAAVGILSLVWVGPTASGAVTEGGVLTTPRDEILPAADRWFLWSQNSATHPHLYAEYVEANPASSTGPAPRIRVNAVGTQGFSGGILPSGRLIYQQVNGHQSNLKFFNPPTRVRNNPPVGVNTPAWEYRPSASGAWILFGRFKASTHRRKIILFERVLPAGHRPRRQTSRPREQSIRDARPGERRLRGVDAMHRDRLQRMGVRHRHSNKDAPAERDARALQLRPVG